MGKVKSAICLTLMTIAIAVLCIVCAVSFPCGSIYYFNSIISLTDKDADLGGYLIGETGYVGGGYAVVYYPEGVISAQEYNDSLAGKTDEEKEEYESEYLPYANGAIYLEREIACTEGTDTLSEDFVAGFDQMVSLLSDRFERLHVEDAFLQVCDGYTVRVFLPANYEAAGVAFTYMGYTGAFSISYGSDESSATVAIPSQKGTQHEIGYYVKGASARTQSGTSYVIIDFTSEGQSLFASTTASASSDSTSYAYFKIGDNTAFSLTVSEQIDQSSLAVSGGYTGDSAEIVAALIDSAVKNGSEDDMTVQMGEIYRVEAAYGENSLLFVYIALGVCFVGMAAFFLIRYRRLGVAHIYSFLVFLLAMILCVWAISFLYYSMEAILGILLSGLVLCVSNAMAYEYARREYETGKTIGYSVKTGYKKCFWHVFDLHVLLAIAGFFTFFVALTGLQIFAFTFALGTVFSLVCSLAVNRFCWYIMMPFAKDGGEFCHFKREEAEDDE